MPTKCCCWKWYTIFNTISFVYAIRHSGIFNYCFGCWASGIFFCSDSHSFSLQPILPLSFVTYLNASACVQWVCCVVRMVVQFLKPTLRTWRLFKTQLCIQCWIVCVATRRWGRSRNCSAYFVIITPKIAALGVNRTIKNHFKRRNDDRYSTLFINIATKKWRWTNGFPPNDWQILWINYDMEFKQF